MFHSLPLLSLHQEISIDGRGGILGRAGPFYIRTGSGIPVDGICEFDSADAEARSDENWLGVLQHELGHILGIGTMWDVEG
jgi:trimeric autotransporter adhesin